MTIAIIGAGPVGLAAAAHLLARGATPSVLEAGPAAGHAVRQWGHVRMFTPWRYCIDHQAAALLAAYGWTAPPEDDIPDGNALVARYLEPLAAALAPYVRYGSRVTGVTRKHRDKVRSGDRGSLPFVLRVAGPDGGETTVEARAVVDASGTWFTPNPAGADGLPAIGEIQAGDRIATGIPDVLGRDRAQYAGRTTAVVGSGHSALNALIDLAALRDAVPGTRVLWISRKQRLDDAFGGEGADALAARGALGSQSRALMNSGAVEVVAPFFIESIGRSANGGVRIADGARTVEADRIIVTTGFRPDLTMLREMRLALDPWLESAAGIGPMIDPNLHSCGTVRPHGAIELAHPEPDFYIAGMKSYGRAPTFLLATGHEQVRSIAAMLTGDEIAARRVELDLPETGVCSVAGPAVAASSCCGGPAPPKVVSCCVADAESRSQGTGGCGGKPAAAKETEAACCA